MNFKHTTEEIERDKESNRFHFIAGTIAGKNL